MSASDLISRFGKSVTVTRYAAGSYVNGTYVAGATSTFSVDVSVQPIQGRELLNLPEAQRTRRWMKGYCGTELLTADQSDSEKADVVTVDGIDFEVQESQIWEGGGGNTDLDHWKIKIAEVNP